jgi:hypothetical protein
VTFDDQKTRLPEKHGIRVTLSLSLASLPRDQTARPVSGRGDDEMRLAPSFRLQEREGRVLM